MSTTYDKPLGGYVRLSRKGDREELRSPDMQRQAIERYAASFERMRVEFAEPEIDVSGSKASRAILDGLIARVRAGELGGIVVAKLDRLSAVAMDHRLTMFPAGTAPADMPRRGYLREPVLRPFAEAA